MVGVTVDNTYTVALLFLQLTTQLSKDISYHPQNVRPFTYAYSILNTILFI